MVLLEPFMVKQAWSGAETELELEADPGESFLVKGLRSAALVTHDYTEVLIDRVSVGYFYTGDINANHLEQYSLACHPNVFGCLVRDGIHAGFPVATGQKLTLRNALGGKMWGAIEYEKHEEGDMTKAMPNGSEATEYVFLNYGTNSAKIAAAKTGAIDKSRNPTPYPAFPFGADVPAHTEIDIYGFLVMSWKDYPGNLNPNLSYLKLTHERDVLFDEDRNGIYIREGMGKLTWGPCRQTPHVAIEYFPAPRTFSPGEELIVEVTTLDELAAEDVHLAAIEKVRRV